MPEASAVERLLDRIRALRPGQVLLPAGATALAAIVLATAVVAIDDSNSNDDGGGGGLVSLGSRPSETSTAAPAEDGGGAAPLIPFSAKQGHSAAGGESQGSTQYERGNVEIERPSGATNLNFNGAGRYSSGASHRAVQRSAQMVLGIEPAEVGEAAGRVLEAVHANDGIVLQSSVRGGSENDPRAVFDLLIPSAKLSDTLAAFSEIGEVRYRHDAVVDITAPTVTVGEELQDSRARIDSLLAQLVEADTEAEREAVEAELRTERRHAAVLRSQLSRLHRQANLSHVSLRIESGEASVPSNDDSSWGIGDALPTPAASSASPPPSPWSASPCSPRSP